MEDGFARVKQLEKFVTDYTAEQWIMGEEELGDDLAIVRKNVSSANVDRTDFSTELMIHLIYEERDERGLPGTDEELDLLASNEQVIAQYFCHQHEAFFALCVTSGGVRDLFFYLPRHPGDGPVEQALESLDLTIDYDFGIREESDWGIYEFALSDS